ncbi:hypothetical protein, partial [Streptomyces zhihengii]|uniref:hypothetical protein n=1 Tax=Streptomyces zhihengii TaxID=1818004 RepID=UPI003613638C
MFLDTKHAVDRLTQDLLNSGVRAAAVGTSTSPARSTTGRCTTGAASPGEPLTPARVPRGRGITPMRRR